MTAQHETRRIIGSAHLKTVRVLCSRTEENVWMATAKCLDDALHVGTYWQVIMGGDNRNADSHICAALREALK